MNEIIRLTLHLDNPADADRVSGFLALHCPHGWEEGPGPDGGLSYVVHSAHAGFIDELDQTIRDGVPQVRSTRDTVREINWAEAWKEFFTPVECGRHFVVLAPWMEEERSATSRIPLLIEPKTAFGTGHHPTTSLCLDSLSELFSQGKLTSQSRFLDLGTGSGILGIGACLLGLLGDGLDIDPAAVDNARENRELNGIAPERFTLDRGGMRHARPPYDIIMANILAGPLREMAPEICLAKKAGGMVILSGILDSQADSVEAAYMAQGLGRPERHARGEWVCLVFA